MFSTLTNSEALLATRVFSGRKIEAAEIFNRVGTGLKIPGALEDASSFAIAQGVRGEVRAWQTVCQGLSYRGQRGESRRDGRDKHFQSTE